MALSSKQDYSLLSLSQFTNNRRYYVPTTSQQAALRQELPQRLKTYKAGQHHSRNAGRHPPVTVRCFHPLTAFQTSDGEVLFNEDRHTVKQLQLRCGQCIGCRLKRSKDWAIRCMNEAQLWSPHNEFVTLTYKPEALPADASLNYRDYQLFQKRLRRHFGHRIPFYMAGEYGENFGRPHFHACLFNVYFTDRKYHATTGSGEKIYTSETLSKIWGNGFASTGNVTFESAAYIARYICTKVTGKNALMHYADENGVVRTPEFNHMSLKPAIGKLWLGKYLTDVYPTGQIVVNGQLLTPPKYYDKLFEELDQSPNKEAYDLMQYGRHLRAIADAANNTHERLNVQEVVANARLKLKLRKLS